VVYGAFSKIKESGANPLETFDAAIRNLSPLMEVRSRRVGGANYQVPREVPQEPPPCARVPLAHRLSASQERPPDGNQAR